MAGYCGQRMSWNAVEAYQSGSKPLSQWTKSDILEGIKPNVSKELFDEIKKLKKDTLVDEFLRCESWHHTGKFYNKTEFYTLIPPDDDLDIESIKFAEFCRTEKMQQKKDLLKMQEMVKKRYISYVYFINEEMIGTKNYPRWESFYGKGILSGDYCYVVDYEGGDKAKRKNIHGARFGLLKQYKTKPRDFDKRATDAVLKTNKLGRYAPNVDLEELKKLERTIIVNKKKLEFDECDLCVKETLEEILDGLMQDQKSRKWVSRLLKTSINTEGFIMSLMNSNEFKNEYGYIKLLLLSEKKESSYSKYFSNKRWYAIRALFGDKRFYAYSSSSSIRVGGNDLYTIIPSGCYQDRFRIAVFENNDEDDRRTSSKLRSLMNHHLYLKGSFNIYDEERAPNPICELNGGYEIYYYDGLIAFIKVEN